MSSQDFLSKVDTIDDLLFGFAMKLTRNKEEAKDLHQETLFRAFKNRMRFRIGTNFKAWLTTIMRNTFINNYRKKRTRNKVEQPIEDLLYSIENKAVSNDGERNLLSQELQNILNDLKSTYRVPFLMYFQGYQYNEVAEHLNIPIGTVKSRIYFARKTLSTAVKAKYGERIKRA